MTSAQNSRPAASSEETSARLADAALDRVAAGSIALGAGLIISTLAVGLAAFAGTMIANRHKL